MLNYILIFIKLILIQLAYNTLLTKTFLSFFILLFIIYYFNRKKTIITLEDLGIKHIIDIVPFILSFFIFYIFGLLYIRFCSFGKSLDLKIFYNKFKIFLIQQDLSYIFITSVFYILIIIVFLIFFHHVIKAIKLNILKIHIYITSFFPLGIFQNTAYNTFKDHYFSFHRNLLGIFHTLYCLTLKYKYIYIYKQKYDPYKITKIHLFLTKIEEKNALIILIILIIYDIKYNNFVLTKMYYFMPIVFLYNLIILIYDSISKFQPCDEGAIVSHLYFDVETLNMDSLEVQYSNNFEVSLEDLKRIEIMLNKEFG